MDANWQYEDRNKRSIFLFQFVTEQINLQGRLHLEIVFRIQAIAKPSVQM
jgi:hypothetical protein